MKAIINIASRDRVFAAACEQIKAAQARPLGDADYHLSFGSARLLLSELTPARIDLLEVLSRHGPCPVYALAKVAGCNYFNTHADIRKLEEHGLVQRTSGDAVFVPFESVEIHLARAYSASESAT